MRTAGAECEANAVDAEAVLRFTLKTIHQFAQVHEDRDELIRLLRERARAHAAKPDRSAEIERDTLGRDIAQMEEDLATVSRRMALEKDDQRYETIAQEHDRLKAAQKEYEERMLALKTKERNCAYDPDEEVAAAMGLLDQIDRITSDGAARAEINPLMARMGIRIGLNFTGVIKGKKRVVRKRLNGVVFGDGDLPVQIHGKDNVEAGDGGRDDRGSNREGGEEGGSAWKERNRTENAVARTGAGPILAVSDVRSCERRHREGVSSTKVGRGGRI